jgi:hypothetical protein
VDTNATEYKFRFELLLKMIKSYERANGGYCYPGSINSIPYKCTEASVKEWIFCIKNGIPKTSWRDILINANGMYKELIK